MAFLKGLEKYFFLPLAGALIGTFVQLMFYPGGANSFQSIEAYPVLSTSTGSVPPTALRETTSSEAASSPTPTLDKLENTEKSAPSNLPAPQSEASWADTMATVGVVATLTWLFWITLNRQ